MPNKARPTDEMEISSDLISLVRTTRDESKRAEEEVNATKRQLWKALPPALRSPGGGLESQDDDSASAGDNNGGSRTGKSEADVTDNREKEVIDMFKERFADIFSYFEGLMADCRISVEEMSFTADVVG